jgi:ferric enterobactin receptor
VQCFARLTCPTETETLHISKPEQEQLNKNKNPFMRKTASSLKRAVVQLFLLVLLVSPAFAQEKTVSGTVIADDDAAPLLGVTVTNTRTNKRVQTNTAGFFTIAADKGDVLNFMFVGFSEKQATIGDEKLISVRLVSTDKDLGNVVVTAYGIKRDKKTLTYSVTEVKGEDIAQTRRENFINGLAGRVPGATITSTSGLPGASSTIILRGATSIGGNNQPLFVVDGVPYDNQTLNQENLIAASNTGGVGFANRNSDYGNRAMDINPEDIETVSILKGPEATALYGSQGASGVVLITTKKGKAGRSSVTYDNSFGWSKIYRFPEVQNVYDRGLNGIKDYSQALFFGQKYPAGSIFYDNFNNFFQTGMQQSHSLSFEGGAAGTTYRLSASYVQSDGVVPTTGFDRATFRASSSSKIGSKVNLTTNVTYINTSTIKASKGYGYFVTLLNTPPNYDIRDYTNANGTRKTQRGGSYTSEFDNPFWDVYKNTSSDKTSRFQGNATISYDATSWLTFTGIAGVDFYTSDGNLKVHPQSRYGFITNGFLSVYEQRTSNANLQFRAVVRKKIGEFNNIFTIGTNIDDFHTVIDAQKGEQFYEPEFGNINNTTPTTRDAKSGIFDSRNIRFYANYNVNYKFLNFSLGATREGDSKLTSKFYPDKDPYFNYGSIGINIIPTDIPAVKKALPWMTSSKLRYNFATTGKSVYTPYAIDYAFVSNITTGGGYALGVTGGNQNLRPEVTNQTDMGFEFKVLKNRLGIDFTYYMLKSRDQILAARTSYLTGYVLKFINGGEVENKGLEIALTGSPIQSKNFTWDVTVNFDKNVGKITAMPKDLPFYYDSDSWLYGNARSQAFQGSFTGNLAGYSFQKNAAGDLLIDPATGYPINDNNFQNIADRQPDFKIGLINSFGYKGFNLNFNIDIRKGGDVFNANEMYLYTNGLSVRTLDREQPRVIKGVLKDGLENTATPTRNAIALTPYYTNGYYSASVSEADFIESVDWVRLRDITLAYKFSPNLLKRIGLFKGISVSVSATDLFMITNYSGADPNVSSLNASSRGFGGQGIDWGSVSNPRRFNAGIRVQL